MTTPPPKPKAAALRYDKEKEAAPRLVARGQGPVAEKILELARQHDIPIRSDADLMAILETVEIDQEIPLSVYAAVAEIFAYLYQANLTHAQRKA